MADPRSLGECGGTPQGAIVLSSNRGPAVRSIARAEAAVRDAGEWGGVIAFPALVTQASFVRVVLLMTRTLAGEQGR
jgi:hypothetical protein